MNLNNQTPLSTMVLYWFYCFAVAIVVIVIMKACNV